MAKYFTPQELISSVTAQGKGIDNTPPPAARVALAALANKCLDPVRELWGAPITVTSGYRSPRLNKAVGGVPNSQHMKGEAADITVGSPSENKRLFNLVVAARARGEVDFDQLIDESGKRKIPYTWLHISYRTADNRRQILHL